ncbi:MAG TPA: ATP-binding cassette domain-containing protein [Chloroflexi bacterium]|jgi:ABC-2 type transport system ATP-binding protein|nr:ATP-binding cassette domain-containing protein [Chloroflexota bacterium]
MIAVQGLTKEYGTVRALDGLSFSVNEGEILGFLGPNGAGKTTTMRILTGYMPPTAGSVSVAGYDVVEQSLEARRRIGYLPETAPLYGEMTVYDYLDFCASIRRVGNRRRAVDRVLEACDIGDVSQRHISKLSKGYRQRVGLAQALVHDPDVLVLDEPTIGLDPRQILSVRELIKGLGGERTIILSTHILPEVSQVCQRVLIINRGRIVAEDTPERLTSSLQGGTRVQLQLAQAAPEAAEMLAGVAGVRLVTPIGSDGYEVVCDGPNDPRPELAAMAVHRGWGLLEMRSASMSLEEVFIQLTTDEAAETSQGEGEALAEEVA